MASVLYILDSKGNPLIYRSYRGDVAQDVPAVFQKRIIDEEESRITPVFEELGHTYTFVRENDIYLLLVSNINTCSLQQITFLKRCVFVFKAYFKVVTQETVQDNFVIIYELLDEMCDFGFPQFTEEKALREYIMQSTFLTKIMGTKTTLAASELPAAVTGAAGSTPWRLPRNYKYKNNQVFLDVIEQVDLLANQAGDTLSSEVLGSVKMQSCLSGMPTCTVGLNDKILFDRTGRHGKSVEMDDITFHRCVKLNQFESERIITFVPPDGEFTLLTYRLNEHIQLPVQIRCTFTRHGTSRVRVHCTLQTKYRSSLTANEMEVLIPIPSDADRPQSNSLTGHLQYAPQLSSLVWNLGKIAGGRQCSCSAEFHLPSIRSSDSQDFSRIPVRVRFTIPYFAASGFQVRYVKVSERSNYVATPWVRYVTQSGVYEIRTD
ncbi:putative adaptor complex AP-1 medium subunit [Leptomonas seymouri]|uniref:Putative adaptor complex AP-1 medium subunit n=1 Tax=Leptomonas seymouri TaxID=5684 RepID=A0A0N1I7F0_LEPSE|nr:putative adaptor complex AP-1 medium subunit [Leptomonas seymouri]|eukprot:KPI89421.1 putative adaptor complex AP-1 medium subunit [Leptomonas seymouri]